MIVSHKEIYLQGGPNGAALKFHGHGWQKINGLDRIPVVVRLGRPWSGSGTPASERWNGIAA